MAEPTDRPLRLGVAGAGRIASDYMTVVPEIDDVDLVAVADVSETALVAAATRTDAATFGSVKEMLAENELDAALVLVPPAAHEGIALELLARGVHVLCEKPLAPTVVAAEEMVRSASRAGVQLVMASKFRHVSDMLEAQRLIREGVIGEPVTFDCSFCSSVDMTRRWNSDAEVSGGGVLIDNGSHAVDIARMLLGPVARVSARFGLRVQPLDVEDSVRVLFETQAGCVGLIDLSWSVDKAADHYVSVQGTRGTVQVGWRGSRYRLADEEHWRDFGRGYDKRAALAAQIRNFAGAIREREQPLVSSDDALASVRTIEAAYRSVQTDSWVAVQGAGD